MSSYTCVECEAEVRGGEAVVRSISFRQVAYCQECWGTNHAPPVPSQRSGNEDAREAARHRG